MELSKPYNKKKRRYFEKEETIENSPKKHHKKNFSSDSKEKNVENTTRDSNIQNSIVYYENILKTLRTGIENDIKDDGIYNMLEESKGKEIDLSCHSLSSHCLELLLSQCKDTEVILRFMTAFATNKIPTCTSANASHITELLIHHAFAAIQKAFTQDSSEDTKERTFAAFCIEWITEFGNFFIENLQDCLSSQFSCHVLCTLIGALAGDLAEIKEFMSKNLKNHKQEFQSQFNEINSSIIKDQKCMFLELIPDSFVDILKKLCKSIIKSDNLIDFINDSSSATVIEALIFGLKKRLPKSFKKMITKITKKLFIERNKDNVPVSLLHKNASFVFDEMFKVADEDLQTDLWNTHISDYIAKLVVHPVGNFVVQRLYDAVKSRTLMETMCKHTWCLFDDIIEAKNFGIFVSIASACTRLSVQQSFFMENIMQCLHCFEPIQRQDLVIPLLLGFQKYEEYSASKNFKICLQGSLVAQAILKFQKPIKAVKSILSMPPEDIEYLTGHNQGCHVLNALFGSKTVGDKNKEMLILHMQPVLVNIACDRNKSLTLSRIWTCLSLKIKEMIARHLAQHQSTLKACKSGYAIYMKFGIVRLKKLQEWRQMQSNITCIKKPKQ